MTLSDFGNAFRALRKKEGFRQQIDLSQASGVSQSTISRIEDGAQTPTIETLTALANAMSISTDELLREVGHRTNTTITPTNYLESECARLLSENARLHEENQNLKAAIKNIAKGW